MRQWSQLRPDASTRQVLLPESLGAARTARAQPVAGIATALGEHPVWSVTQDALLWVDIDAGRLLRTQGNGATTELFSGAGTLGAALPTSQGRVLLLAGTGVLSVAPDGGDVQPIAAAPPAGMRFNDAGLDPVGRVWAGVLPLVDPAPGDVPTGELWRLDDDKHWQSVFGEMGCPNGIVWSADGRTLLCCESDSRQIAAADYDPATGQASNWRVAWQFSGDGDWVPDGLEWLADGRLWVAFWGLGAAVRFTADGEVDLVVRTADERTTSMATDPSGRVWVTAAAGLSVLD
jgi:sugar lactone lactonase YvrE